MRNSNQNSRFGRGRDSFGSGGGNNRFNNRNSGGRPTMHKVICDECGNECEVPFKPSGDKPVYCSQCFENNRDDSRGRSDHGRPERRDYGSRNSGRSSFDEKRMFQAVCDKCGMECEVPFKPTSGKPVYCSNCFQKGGNFENKDNGKFVEEFKEQFELLNAKVDRIFNILTNFETLKPIKEKKPNENKISEKKVIEKKPSEKAPKAKKPLAKSKKKSA